MNVQRHNASMKTGYTLEELRMLHAELYDILAEVIRICDRHSIPYFVIGGTAIGALYDKGILPWDDDIDIGMKREDYNRFLDIAQRELRPQYFLSWFGTEPHSPYYFAKVKKHDTLFVESMFSDLPLHPGIFVDVFPFDRIPDNRLLRKAQRGVVNFLKCCLMGKEKWLWRHCGTCAIDNPTNRGFLSCLLTRMVNVLPKRVIYRLMVGTQGMFNSWKTAYYNNVVTTTDHVRTEALDRLQPTPFGPLTVTAPEDLEGFLRFNYPHLHRFTPEEQQQANNHYPTALKFSSENL